MYVSAVNYRRFFKIDYFQKDNAETLSPDAIESTKDHSTMVTTPDQTIIHKQRKERSFLIFENQRWWPGKGWCSQMLPGERSPWSDDFGKVELRKESIILPNKEWEWTVDWTFIVSANTDSEGWDYASRFKKFEDPFRKKSFLHSVRRRKWIRTCAKIDDSILS